MAIVPKLIKAALNLSRALPEQVLSLGLALVKGLTGNSNFSSLPVDLVVLKAELDAYSVYITDAKDGGKKAITLRDKQGVAVIRMIKQLATYVEVTSKEDMNVFLSSGFQPRSSARTAAQPLDRPVILGIEQGAPGELVVSIKSLGRVRPYELRYGVQGAGGADPAVWSMLTRPNARPISVSGLTAGTTYAFQVRAYGPLGYTEYSASMARMVI
jgi:hypothetical protein